MAKGLEKGKAEGLAEAQKQIVLTMLQQGLSTVQIAQFTGMKAADIEQVCPQQTSG